MKKEDNRFKINEVKGGWKMKNVIFSIVTTILLTSLVSAQSYGCPFGSGSWGMMNYGNGIFGLIFGVLLIVALVLLIFWLIKQLNGNERRRK